MNTTDSILKALEEMAEEKGAINPSQWLTACSKLVALLGNEQSKLFELESAIAKIKSMNMEGGDTAARAKVKAEASPEYLEARKLKAKIERCYEIIRLGKIQARMSMEEFKSN